MECTAEAAKCVVHLGRSYPREDPSCSGPVPTAKTTLNPAHVRPRPERRALHNEPRLDDDTIRPGWTTPLGADQQDCDIMAIVNVDDHPQGLRRKRRGMSPKWIQILEARLQSIPPA